jgi:hypothetical protein
MRKLLLIPTVAATMLALAACQSPEADTVEDSAEAEADGIDEMADEAPTEAQEKGEETADSMDDNRETAPSETRSSDPQNK